MNHVTEAPGAGIGSTYRMGFTVGEHSARHMRRILRIYLEQWGMPALGDPAALALTELVANVVRHVPDRHCAVLILRQSHGLRVEVVDPYPEPPRISRNGDVLADGGRGLLLVEAVTDRWGTEPAGTGKTVWFECDAKAPVPRRRVSRRSR